MNFSWQKSRDILMGIVSYTINILAYRCLVSLLQAYKTCLGEGNFKTLRWSNSRICWLVTGICSCIALGIMAANHVFSFSISTDILQRDEEEPRRSVCFIGCTVLLKISIFWIIKLNKSRDAILCNCGASLQMGRVREGMVGGKIFIIRRWGGGTNQALTCVQKVSVFN